MMATYPHCDECGCDLLEHQELEEGRCYDCQQLYDTPTLESYPNSCMYCGQPLPKPMILCQSCYDIEEEHILSMKCPICFSEDVVSIVPDTWACNECGWNWSDE